MLPTIGIAIGAGVASGLLFSVTMKGTAIAMALAYLAPLPTMIVALAYGLQADVIAVIVAGAVVGGVVDPVSGLIFAATIALPAGLLAGLAGIDRINPYDHDPKPKKPYRAGVGTLALTAAGFGFVISAGAIAIMIVVNGGYTAAIAAFRAMMLPSLEEALSSGVDFPQGLSADDLGRLILRYAPAAIAASTTLMLLINLYLAARTAQLSGRLPRPWTDLPAALHVPALAGLVALAALVGWYFAPEPFNPFLAALAAPLALIFLFQGLATLHELSRRAPGRPAVIMALYLALFLAPRWIGPAVVALGLAESALKLRARAAKRPPPKPANQE